MLCFMTDEDRLRLQAQSARLIHMNEGVVFPLLKRNMEASLDRMVHEFRKSGTPLINEIAYMAACKDLMNELMNLARRGDAAVIKLQQD